MKNWTLTASAITLPPARVFGFASRATDRYEPAVEVLTLGEKHYPPKEMHLSLETGRTSASQFRKGRMGRFFPKKTLDLGMGIFVDMRIASPDNWAHNIFYQTPLALQLQRMLGEEITVVLPRGINRSIYELYDLLGLKTVITDQDVTGALIYLDHAELEIATLGRRLWVEPDLDNIQIRSAAASNCTSFPRKIFVNRRDTRKVVGDWIPDFIKEYGYDNIYLEDYGAADQISILNGAEQVIGIHGAGLAPLLYSFSKINKVTLIGLMPALQVTSGFRLLCHQCDINWIGVRGKIEPAHARYLYDDALPPFKTSHIDFEICPASLSMALDCANRAVDPNCL